MLQRVHEKGSRKGFTKRVQEKGSGERRVPRHADQNYYTDAAQNRKLLHKLLHGCILTTMTRSSSSRERRAPGRAARWGASLAWGAAASARTFLSVTSQMLYFQK